MIGRKNHYGSRSRRGTEVAALFYSIAETAKLAALEPKAYLRGAVLSPLRGEQPGLPQEILGVALPELTRAITRCFAAHDGRGRGLTKDRAK